MAALKERRDARKLPHLDDKVITGWNGLMIEAYADAGRVLGDTAYLDAAGRAADFVLREMRTSDGDLLRIWRAGDRGQEAFQEDYAFFVRGLTALHRATGDERWLDAAVDLADRADHLFHDDAGGGYFFASPAPDLLARSKSPSEGALPSGNAVMAHALLDLAELTGDVRWRARAEEVLSTFSGSVARSPASYASMALAMERLVTQGEGAGDTGPAPDADPTSQIGSGPAVDSSDRVRMFARVDEDAVRPGEPFTVRVRMKVDRGWHINANPASLPELIPTTMDVRSDAPITVEQIAYPDPDKFETQFSDAPLDVYDGILNLTARVRLDPASTSLNQVPMRILVRYQACDEGSCLAPAEQILDVSVPVSQK
jgi:hypothetical protein